MGRETRSKAFLRVCKGLILRSRILSGQFFKPLLNIQATFRHNPYSIATNYIKLMIESGLPYRPLVLAMILWVVKLESDALQVVAKLIVSP